MAINYSFIDGALYGTDDINSIAQNLTGAGVMPFTAKDSYNVSDLNALTSGLVSTGVQLDGCKCSVENAGTAEMLVRVAKGIVFFESGVSLTVDEEGYIVAITPNTAGYVYAHYSPSLPKADIVFGDQLPTDGEYVLLAEVLEDGSIMDKRTYAKSKVATMGKNVVLTASFTPMEKTLIREEGDRRYFAIANVSGVDLSKFNYALIGSMEYGTSEGVPYGCFYDLANNRGLLALQGNYDPPSSGTIFMTGANYSLWYGVEVFNNELCIVAYCSIMNSGEKYINNSLFSYYTATFM